MSSDAPEDECATVPSLAGRRSTHGYVPYVLQVSPIDTELSEQDEFYYDPFADLNSSDFAAASGEGLLPSQWLCRRLPRLS